jgi:hypothetical protein
MSTWRHLDAAGAWFLVRLLASIDQRVDFVQAGIAGYDIRPALEIHAKPDVVFGRS